MFKFLISRYCRIKEWRGGKAKAPLEYPEVGVYHPRIENKIATDASVLPQIEKPVGTVGLLLMRSYVLSSDTAHYDAVIRKFESERVQVIPVFAGGLDGRPAIEQFFKN